MADNKVCNINGLNDLLKNEKVCCLEKSVDKTNECLNKKTQSLKRKYDEAFDNLLNPNKLERPIKKLKK